LSMMMYSPVSGVEWAFTCAGVRDSDIVACLLLCSFDEVGGFWLEERIFVGEGFGDEIGLDELQVWDAVIGEERCNSEVGGWLEWGCSGISAVWRDAEAERETASVAESCPFCVGRGRRMLSIERYVLVIV
jgi:hypothetical protein